MSKKKNNDYLKKLNETDPEVAPLPEHHKTILDERLKTLDEDMKKGELWSKFKKNYL